MISWVGICQVTLRKVLTCEAGDANAALFSMYRKRLCSASRSEKSMSLYISLYVKILGRRMKNEWNHPQTLRGSFSAVSTATIATKYSFFQDFRDLQDLHSFAPLRSQNFSKKPSKFLPEWKWNFIFQFRFSMRFAIFLRKFDEILPEFHRNVQEMTNCLDILGKSARKILKMLEISRIKVCEKFSFFISFFHSSPYYYSQLFFGARF